MLKTIAKITVTASVILLAACAGEVKPNQDFSNIGTISPSPSPAIQAEQMPGKDIIKPDATDFQAGVLIDWSAAEDQLTENHRPALVALNQALVALVEHDYESFRVGFVTEELADALDFYYDDQAEFSFTNLEDIYVHDRIDNQLNLTVAGQRLDAETKTIEDLKYLYAIRLNDQGEWKIHTID